jgi:hypothetical protein
MKWKEVISLVGKKKKVVHHHTGKKLGFSPSRPKFEWHEMRVQPPFGKKVDSAFRTMLILPK